MTQNERLRELIGNASGYVGHTPGCAPKYCYECSLSNQIDAALAEPMTPVEQENARLELMWQEMMQEREQARVESHAAGVRADNAERRERARIEERDEARAEAANLRRQMEEAFYRGAEAMRRDAFKMLKERHQRMLERNCGPTPKEADECAWEVNALPLPAKETQWPSSSEASTSSD